ncbi:unnamed protein product, partial [Amoebophrya sp. A25]
LLPRRKSKDQDVFAPVGGSTQDGYPLYPQCVDFEQVAREVQLPTAFSNAATPFEFRDPKVHLLGKHHQSASSSPSGGPSNKPGSLFENEDDAFNHYHTTATSGTGDPRFGSRSSGGYVEPIFESRGSASATFSEGSIFPNE